MAETDKEFLNELRFKGLIKGRRPFIAFFKKNSTIHKVRSRRYIISYDDEKIYFQSTAIFTKYPNQKDDFSLPIKKLKNYIYNPINSTLASLSIYGKKEYKDKELTFFVTKNVRKYIHSELNFGDFIKFLKSKGVNDIDDELDQEGTRTN